MTVRKRSTIATTAQPKAKDQKLDFWFSDDLEKWIRPSKQKKPDGRRTTWGYKFLPLER